MRKIQTSINLTPEIKSIVDAEGLNLSKFVEDQLEKYFSVSSIEEVNEKISLHMVAISALEEKRADLVSKGAVETKGDGMKKLSLQELENAYVYRKNHEEVEGDDLSWIGSPKNVERCRRLGKDPKEALVDLKEWFYGEEKK